MFNRIQTTSTGNLRDNIPTELPAEVVDSLLTGSSFRVERIVSLGHASPPDFWYDQPEHEWVLVIQGSGTIEFADGRQLTLQRGDYINIPAHCKHRVIETSPETETIWLAIFFTT